MTIIDRLTPERRGRYLSLKRRMRDGEFVPRDDFLFVRAIDQCQNAHRNFSHRGFIQYRGYNTAPR